MKTDSHRKSYTNGASSLMLPALLYQKGIENMAEGISSSIKGALDMDQAALSGYTMLKSMSEFLTPTIEGITHLYPNIDLMKRTADIMPTSAIVSRSFANLLKTLGDNADVASRLQLKATKSLDWIRISMAVGQIDFRTSALIQSFSEALNSNMEIETPLTRSSEEAYSKKASLENSSHTPNKSIRITASARDNENGNINRHHNNKPSTHRKYTFVNTEFAEKPGQTQQPARSNTNQAVGSIDELYNMHNITPSFLFLSFIPGILEYLSYFGIDPAYINKVLSLIHI
mgnify:FL=1